MAANLVTLRCLAAQYGIPYGTVARWAVEQAWPVAIRRSQRLGTPAYYDIMALPDAVVVRLEDRLSQAMQRRAA